MEKLIPLTNNALMRGVFGAGDRNLRFIEKEFSVTMHLKSAGIAIRGDAKKVKNCEDLLAGLIALYSRGSQLNREEMKSYVLSFKNNTAKKDPIRIVLPAKKRFIVPRTDGQSSYINCITSYDITFVIGPAGTGKTYLAMAMAVQFLMQQKVRRIILARPAIEAGESLGFLPGDMHEKLSPYLKPLYDALYDMMEAETIEEYVETGIIEIAPLAYMRGRTLNNAFVILDEAQNCTRDQLKMFLTRLGFDSKTVITGDVTQSDLPGGKPLGLIEAVDILKKIEGIKFSHLTKKDVVRHPLVQKIVQAYEDCSQARS